MSTSPIESSVLSAFQCILLGRKAIYASSELTTGLRVYTMMDEHGASTNDQLRQQIGGDAYLARVLEPNMKANDLFARAISESTGESLVIAPARLLVMGWDQTNYMVLWENVIRRLCKAVWFDENWQYSAGCVQEFGCAIASSVKTHDSEGAILSRDAGIQLIADALAGDSVPEFAKHKNQRVLDQLAS